MKRFLFLVLFLANFVINVNVLPVFAADGALTTTLSPAEVRAIAKEAYIYGFPLVDSYRIQHAYFIDKSNREYKGSWNQVHNISRVFTPKDKAVQTPNSDTPYSMIGMDLRSEPLVLTIPAIEKDRYFSVQLVDAYTFNFDYIGSRTTGNGGGRFLIAGPGWNGKIPDGMTKVIRSETELALGVFRTQLFRPDDLENVKAIQSGYQLQTLSAFLAQKAPESAPAINFIQPLTPEQQKTSLDFFKVLNFVLQFCPTHDSEKNLMNRLSKLNIGAGKVFDASQFSKEIQIAFQEGIADAWKEFSMLKKNMDLGQPTSGDLFGTRDFLKNNYLYRMAAAVVGIYGNSKQEAMYPFYNVDAQGQILDGKNRYTLYFAPNQLPPVNAFWSLTMYGLPESLLVDNPINRYLLNSPMLSQFKRDADGGITFYIQNQSPGPELESNWLPAPQGPFMTVLRLYWPKENVLNGEWKRPLIQKVTDKD